MNTYHDRQATEEHGRARNFWVGCLRGVGRSLRGLIRAWWDVDRVRISPREGKLLGLVPPCVIRVHGEPFQIMNRLDEPKFDNSNEGTAQVRYDCRSSDRSARLLVSWIGPHKQLQLTWTSGGNVTDLDEQQVEVFG